MARKPKAKEPKKRIVTIVVEAPQGVKIHQVMGRDLMDIMYLLKIIKVN